MAGTAGALALGLLPGNTSAMEGKAVATRPFVTGWMPYWLPDSSTDSVVRNSAVFDDASPFVFDVLSATDIDLRITGDQWQTMRSRLRTAGVPIIPTMATNFSADQFASLLSSPTRRQAHVNTLAKLADRYNVAGIDLDYESINFGSASAKQTVRTLYPVFVRELESRLQAKNRLLSVTVASRTSTSDPNWMVYNYAALGEAADRIRIMTYDYHWSGGPPGPIAPKWWVDQVLTFAVEQIEPNKISFGLPAYGRDWFVKSVSGHCPAAAHTTISRSTRDMQKFASQLGVSPRWSDQGTSQTFTYARNYSSGGSTCRAKRVVWFDDARSVAEKIQLVQTHEIRGVAMWALGYETQSIWNRLHTFGQQTAVRKPALSVNAPKLVVYGDDAVVQTTVRSGGDAVSGMRVTLQRRVEGTSNWIDAGTERTGPEGRVRFSVSPRKHVQWRVHTAKDWLLATATSSAVETRLAYDVGVDQVARGSRWTLTGSVSPVTVGGAVVRQKKVDGRWVDKERGRVNRNGVFAFDLRSGAGGSKTLRVVALAGEWERGTSRPIQVTVG
jgi:spore germination protein